MSECYPSCRLTFSGSASVPGSDATAAALEERFVAETMAAMRVFRLALPLAVAVGVAVVCGLFAGPYPQTVALLGVTGAAQAACFIALYVMPAYGNAITAVQLACYWSEYAARGRHVRIGIAATPGARARSRC